MREIKQIIIHCSATPATMDIGAKEIRVWHVKENGWSDIGYHEIVCRSGLIEAGRPHTKSGAHARGHNKHSVGVCVVGGIDSSGKPVFNFTANQILSLISLVNGLKKKYPNAKVIGHNEISAKACPSFDVQAMFGG